MNSMSEAMRAAGAYITVPQRIWHILQTTNITPAQAARMLNDPSVDQARCSTELGKFWQRHMVSRVERTETMPDKHGNTRRFTTYLYALEPKWKGAPYPERGELPALDDERVAPGRAPRVVTPAAKARPPVAPVAPPAAVTSTAIDGNTTVLQLRISNELHASLNSLRLVLAQRFGFTPTFEQTIQHILTHEAKNLAK